VSQGSLFDGERDEIVVYFDGGSRGNPGEAAIGAVVRDGHDGEPLVEISERIGVATNNVAEYRALIAGLEAASQLGRQRLLVRGDSMLVLKQLRGEYRVKHEGLKPLYAEARKLLRRFDDVKLEHVRREQNTDADALVNAALDA
jgi:ribonuclease HI